MEVWKSYGVQAGAILRLTTAYRRLGSLSFGALHTNAYSCDELRYLSLVAEQVALAVDNTLRDEELRKQKAHFEKLFELAPEAIVFRGADDRVLRANKEFTDRFGFTLAEAMGRNISELIVPDGLWDESEELRETLARGERVDAEIIRKKKSGHRANIRPRE